MLRVPDYVGNNYFNTLGNLAVNPRAGLLVIDWESGDLLFLAVRVEIAWEGEEVERVRGARRVMTMRVAQQFRLSDSLSLKWSKAEFLPIVMER